MLNQLTPWTKPIQSAKHAFDTCTDMVSATATIFANPLQDGNDVQTSLAQNIQRLYRASNILHESHKLNIQTNLQLLEFMMKWHAITSLNRKCTIRDTHEAQLPDILPSVQKGIPANANMMFDTM
ncbi:hypothetical protein FIBSPDRAFT_900793 [Athelia psychrophila]|uniref:Uncharacterized protein n=1 Tax=Athelia psychrophila TaxID=1759441 RepID=A0A165Y0I6_9AGAM|nr:hypothetical protein FIBSPDRAFT_900793 [Fibularhizoctonia sp. CBS 109695]